MKHFDIINQTLSTLDPGEPIVTVKLINSNSLRIANNSWTANLEEDSFHNSLVKQFACRKMVTIGPDKGYVIDLDNATSNIKDHVISLILKIYQESCPNKEPRRTKLYRDVYSLMRSAGRPDKTDLLNFMFDIAQYHFSVTKEVSLKDSTNEAHRKNIYKLFEIMENKHGSKKNGLR